MAVLSTGSGHMARSLDLGCGWPISYCPVQAVYQRPGRASFSKGWESEWPLYQSRNGHGIKADGRFTKAGNGRFINNGRFIKAWLVESQWPFYQARWPFYQSQWPLYQGSGLAELVLASFIKAWLVESQWPFYQARWPLYQGQWPLYQGRIKQQWPLYQG